jgi:putative ABC transport system substrate-binding protein
VAGAAQGVCASHQPCRFSFNPATTPYRDIYLKPFKAAALSLAVEATAAPVHDVSDLEAIFAEEARRINSGVIIMPDGL